MNYEKVFFMLRDYGILNNLLYVVFSALMFIIQFYQMSYALGWFWVLCFGKCNITLEFVGQAMTLTLKHMDILCAILLHT